MKLTNKDVKIIRKLSRDRRVPQSYIGAFYNVTQAMVSYIKNNHRHQGVK
jgi:DNA-binding Lrp family transcriptional regulator